MDLTEISRICLHCMKKKNSAGVCEICGDAALPPQEAPLLPIGVCLEGRYCIGRAISKQADGAAYLAYDLAADTPCCVREFYPAAICSRGEDGVTLQPAPGEAAAFAECKAAFLSLWDRLRAFDLAALPPVDAVREADGGCFAVLRAPGCRSLRDALLATEDGYFSWEDAAGRLLPVLQALEALHGEGLVHFAISPETLCAAPDGRLLLLDFVIPQAAAAASALRGEPARGYAAPELYDEAGETGEWTDVYAVTAVLYRMLTGITPQFAPDRLENDTMVIPAKFADRLPLALIGALIDGMQPEPLDRIRRMRTLAEALQTALKARPAGPEPAPAQAPAEAPASEPTAEEPAAQPSTEQSTTEQSTTEQSVDDSFETIEEGAGAFAFGGEDLFAELYASRQTPAAQKLDLSAAAAQEEARPASPAGQEAPASSETPAAPQPEEPAPAREAAPAAAAGTQYAPPAPFGYPPAYVPVFYPPMPGMYAPYPYGGAPGQGMPGRPAQGYPMPGYPMPAPGMPAYPMPPRPGYYPPAAAKAPVPRNEGAASAGQKEEKETLPAVDPQEQEKKALAWEKEERARAMLERRRGREKTTRRLRIILILLILLFVLGLALVISAAFGKNANNSGAPTPAEQESYINADVPVPDFVGQKGSDILTDARYFNLFRFEPIYETNEAFPAGQIFQQSPQADSLAHGGDQVILYISKGADLTKIPDVTGLSFEQASLRLSSYGRCTLSTRVNDGAHTPNTVAETLPPAGSPYTEGMEITVIVWGGIDGTQQDAGADPALENLG